MDQSELSALPTKRLVSLNPRENVGGTCCKPYLHTIKHSEWQEH